MRKKMDYEKHIKRYENYIKLADSSFQGMLEKKNDEIILKHLKKRKKPYEIKYLALGDGAVGDQFKFRKDAIKWAKQQFCTVVIVKRVFFSERDKKCNCCFDEYYKKIN